MPNGFDLEGYLKKLPVTDDVRAAAWDAYHGAKSSEEFTSSIRGVGIPENAKADLWDQKNGETPAPAQAPAAAPAESFPPVNDLLKNRLTPSLAGRGSLPEPLTSSFAPPTSEPPTPVTLDKFGKPTISGYAPPPVLTEEEKAKMPKLGAPEDTSSFLNPRLTLPVGGATEASMRATVPGLVHGLESAGIHMPDEVRPDLDRRILGLEHLFNPKSYPGAAASGGAGAVSGLTSEQNIKLIEGLTAAAPVISTIGAGPLISAYFGADMAKQLKPQSDAITAAFRAGDSKEAVRLLGELVATAAMSAGAFKHAGSETMEMRDMVQGKPSPFGMSLNDPRAQLTLDQNRQPVINGELAQDRLARRMSGLSANESASRGLDTLDQRAVNSMASGERPVERVPGINVPIIDKRANPPQEGDLSRPSATTPENLAEVIRGIQTGTREGAIFTAENPNGKTLSPEENSRRNAELTNELKSQGFDPIPLQGFEDGTSANGFIVPGMTTKQALDLQETMGQKYGHEAQQGVITKQGLIDVASRSTQPIRGLVTGQDALSRPYHSTVQLNSDTQVPFSFDFEDKSLPVREPFVGRHFSDLSQKGGVTLSGNRRGLAGGGQEIARLSEGRGAPGGVYTYPEGVRPEPQYVGRKGEYSIEGEHSLADLSVDRRTGLYTDERWNQVKQQAFEDAKKAGYGDSQASAISVNELEHAIKDAGYTGYRSGVEKPTGAAFLFGDINARLVGEEAKPLKEEKTEPVAPLEVTPSDRIYARQKLAAENLARAEREQKIFRGKVEIPEMKRVKPSYAEKKAAALKSPEAQPVATSTSTERSEGALSIGFNPVAAVHKLAQLVGGKQVPQKSIGTDPLMDEILDEQAEGKQKSSTRQSIEELWTSTQEKFYDRLIRVAKAVKAAKARGVTLSPRSNPETMAALAVGGGAGGGELAGIDFTSIAGRAYKDGVFPAVNKLLNYKGYERAIQIVTEKEAAARAAGDVKLADEYLDKLQKNKVVPKGYDSATIKSKLLDLEQSAGANWPKIQSYAKEVWTQNSDLWKRLKDDGIISSQVYFKGIERGPEYIPLERLLNDQHSNLTKAYNGVSPTGLSLSEQKSLQALEGSEATNVSPFESSISWHSMGWKEIWRNRAARALIDLADADKNGLGKETFQLKGGSGVPNQQKFGVVAFFKDGQVQRYAVPRLLADAMKNLSSQQVNFVGLGAFKYARDLLRMGATGANLAFSIPNAVKDIQEMSLLSKAGPKSIGDGASLLLNWGKQLGSNLGAQFSHFEELRKDPLFRDFMQGGADFSTIQKTLSPETFLEKKIPSFNREPFVKQALSAIRTPLTSVEKFNNAVEQTTKLLAYRRLRASGMNADDAALETRRFGGSPDFARMGTVSPMFNLMFMFFNAGVQGAGRLFTAASRDPRKIGLTLAGLGAAQVALYNWNQQFTNPESNDPEWNHILSSDKQNYFVVITPSMEQTPDGSWRHVYLRLPKAHAFRTLFNPIQDGIEMAQNAITGKPQQPRIAQKSLLSNISNLMPGSFNLEDGKIANSTAISIASSLNPILKEPLEQVANYDTYRRQSIVPKSMEDLEEFAQVSPNTAPLAEKVATANRYIPIIKDLKFFQSPIRIEHAVRGFGAGLGDTLLTLGGKSPAANLGGSSETVKELPVVGPVLARMLGSAGDQELRTNEENFYDMYGKSATAYRTYLSLKSQPSKLNSYISDPEKLVLVTAAPMLQSAIETLSQMRKMSQGVLADSSLTDSQKRDYLGKIYSARREYIKSAQDVKTALEQAQAQIESSTPRKESPAPNPVPDFAPQTASPSFPFSGGQ